MSYQFGFWVHFMRAGGLIKRGCIEAVTDKQVLKTIIDLKDGKKSFLYSGFCSDKQDEWVIIKDSVFYDVDNFYAYRLLNGKFVNIKDEILKELNFL